MKYFAYENWSAHAHITKVYLSTKWHDLARSFVAYYQGRWQRFYRMRYRLLSWYSLHGFGVKAVVLILLVGLSAYLSPTLQDILEPRFSNQTGMSALRSLLTVIGGALTGAVAIAFSLVVFAMQVNVERMPHGLFHKLSSDKRIMVAFAGTFISAIIIASASLIPDTSGIAIMVLIAAWGIVTIFLLFLYAYRRALRLINPATQLALIVDDATKQMKAFVTYDERVTPPLPGVENTPAEEDSLRSSHDLTRMLFFQNSPNWTAEAKRAIRYAVSYARKYAEKGDYDTAGIALASMVKINEAYIAAKGKTFFANQPFFDSPLSTDGFINDTLEHLRQNVRIGIGRGDEPQIEQTLQTIASLSAVYLTIDYSSPTASKSHAHLAAGYLSEAVESVAPHDMADVLMEGVRLWASQPNSFLLRVRLTTYQR